jgi:hypothetical protein
MAEVEALLDELSSIDPQLRTTVEMRVFEGFSIQDIAFESPRPLASSGPAPGFCCGSACPMRSLSSGAPRAPSKTSKARLELGMLGTKEGCNYGGQTG